MAPRLNHHGPGSCAQGAALPPSRNYDHQGGLIPVLAHHIIIQVGVI